jgi:hypothetical protein
MAWNTGVDTRLILLDFSAAVYQIHAPNRTTADGVPSPESGNKLNHQSPIKSSAGRLEVLLAD